MRVSLSFTSIAGVLIGLWLAIGVPAGVFAADTTNNAPQLVIAEPAAPANLLNYTEYYQTADTKEPAPKEAAPTTQVNCGAGCGSCGCDSGCCAHWILGIETVWLSPQLQRHAVADYAIADTELVGEYRGGVPSGLFMTPRITLGYQGECWGVQTRYWRMNESSTHFFPTVEGPILSTGNFHAETIDVEATRMLYWQDWTNQFAFGVCYAQMDEFSSTQANEVVGTALYSGSAYSRNKFGGPGLTAALSGYRPVNCRNFNLFYSVRGSVLWDNDTISDVETESAYLSGATSSGSINGAIARGNGTMFIGEIQVGTQWNFQLCHKCNDAFVRLALEYQYWNTQDTGGALSVSAAGPVGTGAIIGLAGARAGDARTDLLGFTVATGFTW